MTKRVALYLRVSTNGQTVENQRHELEAVALRHGWQVVATFEGAGISGAKGRDKRPGLDAMMKAVARREIDLIAAWSVDRLGRSLTDLLTFLGELHAKGVDLYLHQQGLDTSTPAGKAMFQMLGVFAEFEREMIRERVNAGLSRAKANGTKLGRPRQGQREGHEEGGRMGSRSCRRAGGAHGRQGQGEDRQGTWHRRHHGRPHRQGSGTSRVILHTGLKSACVHR